MNKQEIEENIAILKSMIPEYEMRNRMFGVKALRSAISALEHQLTNGWIPVSERLPTKEEFNKNDGRFIVTDGMRRYQSLFDIYEGKYFVDITYLGNCNFKETVDNRVIAWQNLPELYKEESE